MRGDYDGAYPMVFFIRDGKIVAANGGADDNIIGWRYARTGCNELGAPFVTRGTINPGEPRTDRTRLLKTRRGEAHFSLPPPRGGGAGVRGAPGRHLPPP